MDLTYWKERLIKWLLPFMFLMMAACAVPITGNRSTQPLQANPMPVIPEPVVVPTTTVEPVKSDEPPAAVHRQLTATQVVVEHSAPEIAPVTGTQNPAELPYIIILNTVEARTGPGLHYDPSHWLEAGTKSMVRGRTTEAQWWMIAGPGDGPGPDSWVSAAHVQFHGDANLVDVYPLPAPQMPNVPVHADPGFPPSDACVVDLEPERAGPVYVRLGPGEQFNVSHRLGGWAEIVKTEIGWHQVLLGPGEVGWVNGNEVRVSALCAQ